MAEETERAVREVDDRADNDQGHYPTSQAIEDGEAGSNKELNEVISCPCYYITHLEAGGSHERRSCTCEKITHTILKITFLVKPTAQFNVMPDEYHHPRTLMRILGFLGLHSFINQESQTVAI